MCVRRGGLVQGCRAFSCAQPFDTPPIGMACACPSYWHGLCLPLLLAWPALAPPQAGPDAALSACY